MDIVKRVLEDLERAAECEPFWYLGGPMSWRPRFNIERFDEVAGKLRESGLKIVSPAEMDDAEVRRIALKSMDGDPSVFTENYSEMLGRDFVIVSLPNCAGAILLDGWQHSKGCLEETHLLNFLGKPLREFHNTPDGGFRLIEIRRDERLFQLAGIE